MPGGPTAGTGMAPGHRLIDRPEGQVLFHRVQGTVAAPEFLFDVHALAAGLPDGGHLVNLCRDRYAFTVGFAAGLVRGCTSLLNADPAALATLAARYPGCLVLADTDVPACLLPVLRVLPTGGGRSIHNPIIPAGHLAAIVFTSGSTGAPVAHAKHWGELVARSRAAAAQFGLAGGTVIGMVPPQHMYGFETTVLLPLHAPVGSWCGPGFFPADIAAALLPCPAPHYLVTTPLQLRLLLQAGPDLPSVTCISATAPLETALAAAIEARWGGPVLEIFGATECGSIASRRATAGPDWTPYPGVELLIEETGTTVVAEGAAPIALADLLEPVRGGFRLLGRRTDVVKLGGRRASLPGLNRTLMALPGVQDGAFVVPEDLDQRSSARLVAVVVAPGRTGSAILADLRRVIDPVFLPRRVIHVDALPRNALGKLPRQALLDLVASAR